MNYSPILVFAYNRLSSLQRTIEALQKCDGAQHSELFVFSDGAKPGSEQKVDDIRNYSKTIDGFKQVHHVNRERNYGCANNIIDGVTEVINQFGCVTVVEDDVIVGKHYLTYSNHMLTQLEEAERVFSITGWSWANLMNIPGDYPYDIFFETRSSSWGWSTWKNRWDKVRWDHDILEKELAKRGTAKKFRRSCGRDIERMMVNQIKGTIDSWSVRFSFNQFLEHGLTVFPIKPLIKNIGFDGQGLHSVSIDKRFNAEFDNQWCPEKIPEQIEIDKTLNRQFLSVFKWQKMKILLEYIKYRIANILT